MIAWINGHPWPFWWMSFLVPGVIIWSVLATIRWVRQDERRKLEAEVQRAEAVDTQALLDEIGRELDV